MPGWKDLIVCGGPDCGFGDLITLAKNVIHDLVLISTIVAVVVFMYAGFVLVTSGGNPGAKTKAKTIFINVLKGYLLILSAWLIVYTVTSVILEPGYSLLIGAPR